MSFILRLPQDISPHRAILTSADGGSFTFLDPAGAGNQPPLLFNTVEEAQAMAALIPKPTEVEEVAG